MAVDDSSVMRPFMLCVWADTTVHMKKRQVKINIVFLMKLSLINKENINVKKTYK